MQKNNIFQIKVIFCDSTPAVCIRIQIPSVFTVMDLLVVVHYAMIVIDTHFPQFNINKFFDRYHIKGKRKIQNETLRIASVLEKELYETFYDADPSPAKYIKFINNICYKIELERTLHAEKYVSYPICIGGNLIFNSSVEINIPKKFFELEKITAIEFIELVFCNTKKRNFSKKGSKRFNNPVSSATLKAWNLWFLKVLQGGFDVKDLIQEFDAILPEQEIEALYSCILHKPIKFRKKAICILSLFKGIPKKYISEYLCVERTSLEGFIERYKSGGLKRLLNHKLIKKNKKYELPSYINGVFSIIHSPPSCHGFNRTTWKLNDIQKVMAKKNLPINRRYISKIINNAGYKVTKARKRLTSNDPNYREKLQIITNILSNLGAKEKFFSIDEYGPFGIKIYGGRSLASPGQKKLFLNGRKIKVV